MNRLLRRRLRHRVIVTLDSGEAFVGLLWEADDQVWVLKQATALGGADPVPLDGEVILPAVNVAYAQKP